MDKCELADQEYRKQSDESIAKHLTAVKKVKEAEAKVKAKKAKTKKAKDAEK